MNYSLFRSKTFWTLIVMCVGNVVSVYGNLIPPQAMAVLNVLLTSVAGYFHLQTGRSQTGKN